MDKKLFDYYTGIKVVVKGSDWLAVDTKRLTALDDMAVDDVKKGKKARNAAEFKNDSEYRIYLISLVQAAWDVENDITPSRYINE